MTKWLIVVVLAACGGSEKRPAPVIANAPPPPPPKPAEPPPPPPPVAIVEDPVGIPPTCRAYRDHVMALQSCAKFPPDARDAMRQGMEAMEQVWSNTGSMPPESIAALEDACKQGLDAMKQVTAAAGC